MSKFVLPQLDAIKIDQLIPKELPLFYSDEELDAQIKENATKLNVLFITSNLQV